MAPTLAGTVHATSGRGGRRRSGYTRGVRQAAWAIPLAASMLAASYLLAAVAAPLLLPVVAAAAAVAGCGLALRRRPHRGLTKALLFIGVWLGVGFTGAWLLRGEPLAGLYWILAVLFVAPLPVIPWLYARTFPNDESYQRGETS